MACHDVESPLQVFDAAILEDVMSIFITSAVLKLIQGVLSERSILFFLMFEIDIFSTYLTTVPVPTLISNFEIRSSLELCSTLFLLRELLC